MVEIYARDEKTAESKKQAQGSVKKPGTRVSVDELKQIIVHTGNEGLFSAYATFPPHAYFENQESGEEVVLFLRQHPVTMIPWIALVLFALTLPSVFVFFPPFATLPGGYQFVVTLMWYLFVFGFALAKFMGWFFNIYILTDERIVDIDFVNILYRKVSTAKIEDIQDVNVATSGAFQTFFNYGNISIQTAAEVPEFEFVSIPRPDKVGAIINQMIDMEEQEELEGRVK
jgi:membrane protein YdbS with pleckstrin-like domain